MKKILAIALALVMVLGTVSLGYADADFNTTVGLDGDTVITVGLNDADYASVYEYSNSDYARKYFDLKAVLDMEAVNNKLEELAELDITDARDASITGNFTITVTLPDSVTLNDNYYDNVEFSNGLNTFGDFYDIPEVTPVNNVLTFTVNINANLKGSDLFIDDGTEATSILGDSLTIVCKEAVKPNSTGEHEFYGTAEGYTLITKADNSKTYNVTYNFGTIPKAVLDITYTGGGGGSRPDYKIPDPIPSEKPSYKVEYVLGTGTLPETELKDTTVKSGSKITLPETAGTREGYVFDGWFVNGKAVSGEIVITEDTVVTAKWINTVPAPGLNSDDHIVYIQGYPDGTVKPNDEISRDEVATIFYRLLTEEKRAEIKKETSDFADAKGHWAEIGIATLNNGGYINGYEDGTFRPTDSITRAEFVTIASRFAAETTTELKSSYSDIKGHWAEEYIKLAADLGWITGYEDGSFKPDATITRAEVITIVNRMLVRYIDAESLIEGVVLFPDNNESDWFYYDVIEATNMHDHERRDNGYHEDWIELNGGEKFEF